MPKRYQVAAVATRSSGDGAVEVLLVTSRETRRWVVPKGWPWPGIADHDAAAGEAWEEAGVRGVIDPDSIGSFAYHKRRRGGSEMLDVRLYRLDVLEIADRWPEAGERQRAWFAPAKAAELVDEPDLKRILANLAQ